MFDSKIDFYAPIMNYNNIKELNQTKEYTEEDLKKACQEFEAIFTEQLLKAMHKTVPSGGILPKSQAQKMWEEMYIEELAKEVALGEGVGVADALYQQLSAQMAYKKNPSE
ncbi:MAG TPA: hypothetical protein GX522_07475 [Firmicutes bacterium]|nr:hypothetical protein [Bacillota bacterium]